MFEEKAKGHRLKWKPKGLWGLNRRREVEQSVWVEVEGQWELNRRKEAEESVWEGAEMLLGFDRR